MYLSATGCLPAETTWKAISDSITLEKQLYLWSVPIIQYNEKVIYMFDISEGKLMEAFKIISPYRYLFCSVSFENISEVECLM